MNYIHNFTAHSKIGLINDLFGQMELDFEGIKNHEQTTEIIGNMIDNIATARNAEVLFSFASPEKIKLFLILKSTDENDTNPSNYFNIYEWDAGNNISKEVKVKIEHENLRENNIKTLINSNRSHAEELISAGITETLDGYQFDIDKCNEFLKYIKKVSEAAQSISTNEIVAIKTKYQLDVKDILHRVKENAEKFINYEINKINAFQKKLNCPELNLVTSVDCFDNDCYLIGVISEVKQILNKRYAKLILLKNNDGNIAKGSFITSKNPTSTANTLNFKKTYGNAWVAAKKPFSDHELFIDNGELDNIPYNFLDKGRIFLAKKISRDSTKYFIVMSEDPKVDPNYIEEFHKTVCNVQEKIVSKSIYLQDSYIEYKPSSEIIKITNKDELEKIYLHSYLASSNDTSNNSQLSDLKKMVDEFKYIKQKKTITDRDISITEKVKFNSGLCKISYGDFSLQIDDNLIRSKIFELFENFSKEYFNQEKTEQEILDELIKESFKYLEDRLENTKEPFNFNITINDQIVIPLECKFSTNKKTRLFYLANQRFNRNEITIVLKEMTCYRDKNESDLFLRTIGKIGLSTYIAMTTGYETVVYGKPKIFRFKKEQGRSKYKLILGDAEISITGKKLISLLYSKFIGEEINEFGTKIDKLVLESVGSTREYITYKFLIDSSYKNFKLKSKEFLDKKVKDTEAEYVTYTNENKKTTMDGIFVTGTSGKSYVIAFDSKDSFVFMDPIKEGSGKFKNGTYICMVDQSNIKSNVGYDTVIAKLMSLKHDSIIAGSIYNLKDQLGDFAEDGNEDDQN